ncbi:alpha/beta hydrolase [Parasphingorhabdus litoris]|uniref:Alpha/beta hydrolase n=1 Tax=Parasphingorhabdus litoris TaxID=394733 RepID=A0ABP3KAA9_9SPHN|nr:alpha/beta hydrolase [Parasphingorhabdus litoris]
MNVKILIYAVLTLLLLPACATVNQAVPVPPSAARGERVELPDGSKLLGGRHFTVLVEGQGRDVVLIPGMSTPRAVWDATRRQLKSRYRLHVIQIRGFGDTPMIERNRLLLEPFIRELTDYIDDEIVDSNNGQKVLLIGHSLGGLAAMKVTAVYPQGVEKAMIIDSLPYFGLLFSPDMNAVTLSQQAVAMRDALIARDSGEADAQTLERMARSETARQQVAAWSRSADTLTVAQFTYDLMTTDVRPLLPKITMPMTVLYPVDVDIMSEQRVTPMYKAAFADAKTVTFEKVDDSRHFIMLDQPEAFAAAVERFLGSSGR